MPRTPALAAALALALSAAAAHAQISFAPQVTYAAATQPDGVAFADINGDGRPDLAATADGPDRVLLRLNTGGGVFGAAVPVPVGAGTGAHSLATLNIDNDADVDLVVTLQNTNQVRVLVNTGGVLTAGASTGVGGTEPRMLAVADLDGNGFVDVVTSNRASGDISVLLNSAGVLGAPALYAIGVEPRGVALADVDGDLLPDIVVGEHDGRTVEVLLNLPGSPGVFTPGPSLSVGAQFRPDGVDVADLDGDGDRDVVAATSGNGLNFATVFFNQGGAVFGPATNFAAGGVNPGAVVAADFDLDGRRDIALANQDSANLSVLRNLGGGAFAAGVPMAAGTNPQALVAADLDLNGAPDLGCANQDSDTVSVYRYTSVLFADGFESGNASHWSAVVP
jgi:hypothetical protein